MQNNTNEPNAHTPTALSSTESFFTPTPNDLLLHDPKAGDETYYPTECTIYIEESFPLSSPGSDHYRLDKIEVFIDNDLANTPHTYFPSLEPADIYCFLSKDENTSLTIPATQSGQLLTIDLISADIPIEDRIFSANHGPNFKLDCITLEIPFAAKTLHNPNEPDQYNGIPYMHIVGEILPGGSSSSDSSSYSDYTHYPD